MRKIILYGLSAFIISHITACRKKDADECPACPKINSISPASGHKGDTVVINGKNFSAKLLDNIVKFNGLAVAASDMISGSTTDLKVRVPAKCGTGPVTVTLDDELYSEPGPVFTYEYTTLVKTYAGVSGIAGNTAGGTTFLNTRFKLPSQLAIDNANNVYVLDQGNGKIRKLDITTGTDAVLSDSNSQVSNPTAMAIDENNILYVSSFVSSARVYKYTPGAAFPAIFFTDFDAGRQHVSITPEGKGQFYIGRAKTNLSIVLTDVTHYSSKGSQPFIGNGGNVVFYKNGFLYQIHSLIAHLAYYSTLSKCAVKDTVETMLIDKAGGLNMSKGLLVMDNGDIYISDTDNNKIIKYSAAGVISTVLAGLNRPQGLALDKQGNIYVAETNNHCIKKISFE